MKVFPNLNGLRITIGISWFFAGSVVSNIDWMPCYILGCLIALVGSWIFSRNFKDISRGGIGWFIIGLPIFMISMIPDSFSWISGLMDVSNITLFVVRFVASLCGAVIMMMAYEN
jgi:hypothetical protein